MAKLQPQRVLDWNGKDLPETLHSLPEGRYVIEEVTPSRALTALEDAGLRRALASVGAGRTTPAVKVHAELRTLIKRGKLSAPKRSRSRR